MTAEPSCLHTSTAKPGACRAFSVKNLKTLQSPIWLSTGQDGRVQHGCQGIPRDRPLLLVSNHQTFAVDIGILIDGLLRQTGLLPRGLTHPAVFQVSACCMSSPRLWKVLPKSLHCILLHCWSATTEPLPCILIS